MTTVMAKFFSRKRFGIRRMIFSPACIDSIPLARRMHVSSRWQPARLFSRSGGSSLSGTLVTIGELANSCFLIPGRTARKRCASSSTTSLSLARVSSGISTSRSLSTVAWQARTSPRRASSRDNSRIGEPPHLTLLHDHLAAPADAVAPTDAVDRDEGLVGGLQNRRPAGNDEGLLKRRESNLILRHCTCRSGQCSRAFPPKAGSPEGRPR